MTDVVPFTSDTFYCSPSPATDFERSLWKAAAEGRAGEMRRLLETSGSVLVSAGVLDVVVRHRNHELLGELLRFPRWSFEYCGPVAVAVYCDDVESLLILLNDSRIDCNIGSPVCVAVSHCRTRCLAELLKRDRVNPNRGNPLVIAAELGDAASVKALTDCPSVQLNKFSTNGSTALIAAIRRDDQALVCLLLSNLRVDPNKGFCCTPLQLAAQLGREECCRLLLARSSTAPNAVVGHLPSPLQIAISTENIEICRLLLGDTRIIVHDGIIDHLELHNKLNLLQLLISSHHFRIGRLWSLRTGALFCATFLFLLVCIFDLFFVVLVTQSAAGLAVLCIHCCSGMVSFLFVKRRCNLSTRGILPIVVPFFPLLELTMIAAFFRNLVAAKPDLILREHQFLQFEVCTKARVLFNVCPLFVVRLLTLNGLTSRAFGASMISTVLYCGLLGVLVWVRQVQVIGPKKHYLVLHDVL